MKLKKKRLKGAALANVMYVCVFVILLSAGLFTMVNTNFRSAAIQMGSAQAYYLTLTGIDLSIAALTAPNAEGGKLIDTLALPENSSEVLKSSISIDPSKNAVVSVEVKPIDYKEGKWIEIKATGSILLTMYDKAVENRGRCLVNVANPAMLEWEINKTV
ncbi:MAG: hypothetical protein LBV08_00290 [Clostridiales bacterium]|nr:hypothetical protein [Clostridiales bacterium]